MDAISPNAHSGAGLKTIQSAVLLAPAKTPAKTEQDRRVNEARGVIGSSKWRMEATFKWYLIGLLATAGNICRAVSAAVRTHRNRCARRVFRSSGSSAS